jgi:hypothetical protein
VKQSYKKPTAKVFQLKVSLQNAETPEWKRIIVPAGIKFSRLRTILSEILGRFGRQLCAFRFEEEKRILNHADSKGRVFAGAIPEDAEYERSDARKVMIDDLLREGGRFYFDCSFGDVSVYEIEVEKLLADDPQKAPRVIESSEASGSANPGETGVGDFRASEGADEARAEGHKPTPVGPNSFLRIADRIYTMSEKQLEKAFDNPETLFGYLIFGREPVFDLREHLAGISRKDLQRVASDLRLSGCSRMKKSQLVDSIYDRYKQFMFMQLIMNRSDEKEIKTLYDIMNAEVYYVEDADFPYDLAMSLLYAHIIEAFYDEDRIAIFVFREFKESYLEALDEMREILDDALEELDECACAAVNLYGVITIENFCKIYLDLSQSDLDEELICRMLSDMIGEEEDSEACYRLRGDLLISEALSDWNDEDLESLLWKSSKYPLYVPPADQFLLYADRFYYEEMPSHRDFIEFIQNKAKRDATECDDAAYKSLTGEICSALQLWASMQECFDILESFGIKFRDLKETKLVSQMIMRMNNDIRIWGNNGATPGEIRARREDTSRKNAERKAGRNEACPCGSGKKYKHCCGKPKDKD